MTVLQSAALLLLNKSDCIRLCLVLVQQKGAAVFAAHMMIYTAALHKMLLCFPAVEGMKYRAEVADNTLAAYPVAVVVDIKRAGYICAVPRCCH